MRTPLYKEGEIVRLLPWDNFDKHISIPGPYWNDLMGKDLEVFNIQTDNTISYIMIDGAERIALLLDGQK